MNKFFTILMLIAPVGVIVSCMPQVGLLQLNTGAELLFVISTLGVGYLLGMLSE